MDVHREQLNEILSSIINDPEMLMRFCISISIDVLRLTIENVHRVHVLTQQLATPPRIPMNVSSFTGVDWINEILEGHPLRCFNTFRMNKETFVKLAYLLENRYHLRERGKLKPIERTALFLYVLSRGASNRETQERFTRGAATVSDHFDDVLRAVLNLGTEYIKLREGHFTTIPDKIYSSDMYNPFFKDCVGALDGCHVQLTVPERERPRWLNRKGETSTNVLAVCDFDLIFIFVLPGWEGSAHDARILVDAMQDPSLGFPLPPDGKYYLGDKGYPNRKGILTSYVKADYHRSDFTLDNPRGPKERFNRAHSSLGSAIERSFGIVKARWQILKEVPSYSLPKQIEIVQACFALHNFIRISGVRDPVFMLVDESPNWVPDGNDIDDMNNTSSFGQTDTVEHARVMANLRDKICEEMVERRNARRRCRA